MTIKEYILFPLKLFFNKLFRPVYKVRVAKIISDLCPDNSYILDYGCDDGSTAKRVMKFNPSLKIVGVDIQSNRPAKIPRKTYDGKKIPYPSNTFDIVMSLDVLHHTKNIPEHIKEMKRVSKKYLIIKDHMRYGFFSKLLISFTDYISNVSYGIKCAFNFPLKKEWYQMFKEQNLDLIKNPKKLNFGFGITERYNLIFKLQKK
ncbi:MAG: class I SAM-dependent methyltransferase [Candidatus Woesearchaeota archaeon]